MEDIDFAVLESQLETAVRDGLDDLNRLRDDYEALGNPVTLGETVGRVVWEQFINQIGVMAGEEFIAKNRNLNLDLSRDAHIQTTDNFASGKIASHNRSIDYQKRYDDWQGNFQHNADGSVKVHTTRSGRLEPTLVPGARTPYDRGRPSGSAEKGTNMDHTIPAAEAIRDARSNAHLDLNQRVEALNSDWNLIEMDDSLNKSKGDKSMTEWLDYPNSKGQRPRDIAFKSGAVVDDELDAEFRERDRVAREEYEKVLAEGEQRSVATGKASRRAEARLIGGQALKAVLMGLLADLVKTVVRHLIEWFVSGKKALDAFIEKIKQAVHEFVARLARHLATSADVAVTVVATAILGPVVGVLKKTWTLLKQGFASLREALDYLRRPETKRKPFRIVMLEVSKIVVAGLTAAGALVVGEVIEKGLMSIPFFAFPIPLLGSLASVLGLFFGALVCGVLGAVALALIDRAIASSSKKVIMEKRIEQGNIVLEKQALLQQVAVAHAAAAKSSSASAVSSRHSNLESALRATSLDVIENHRRVAQQCADAARMEADTSRLLGGIMGKLEEI